MSRRSVHPPCTTAPSPDGPEPAGADPSAASPAARREQDSPVEREASLRMLLGAIDAFAERGFHATTTRDIAGRAGLSPAALYVHYPSKAALLAQISLRGHHAALDLVAEAAALDLDPIGRLHTLVAEFVSWHAEHHRTARVVQYELRALPPQARQEVHGLRRQIEQQVEDLIQAGIADGGMDVEHPRRVARAILSLGVDVARWYDPGGRDTPADLGELYAGLAVRMVGADPPACPHRLAERTGPIDRTHPIDRTLPIHPSPQGRAE